MATECILTSQSAVPLMPINSKSHISCITVLQSDIPLICVQIWHHTVLLYLASAPANIVFIIPNNNKDQLISLNVSNFIYPRQKNHRKSLSCQFNHFDPASTKHLIHWENSEEVALLILSIFYSYKCYSSLWFTMHLKRIHL